MGTEIFCIITFFAPEGTENRKTFQTAKRNKVLHTLTLLLYPEAKMRVISSFTCNASSNKSTITILKYEFFEKR